MRWKTRTKTNSNYHSIIIITCHIFSPTFLPPRFGSTRFVSSKLAHGCPKVFHKYAAGAVPPPRPNPPPPPAHPPPIMWVCVGHARPTVGRAYGTLSIKMYRVERGAGFFRSRVGPSLICIRSKRRTSSSRPSIVAHKAHSDGLDER